MKQTNFLENNEIINVLILIITKLQDFSWEAHIKKKKKFGGISTIMKRYFLHAFSATAAEQIFGLSAASEHYIAAYN